MSIKKLKLDLGDNPLDELNMQDSEGDELAQIFSTAIPQPEPTAEEKKPVSMIPIDKIIPSKNNRFDQYAGEKRAAMVDSIRENGIITPLTLRKLEQSDMYEIISGENRWRCGQEAGLNEVPANVMECDEEQAIMLLTEANLMNRDVSFRERVVAYRQQYDVMKKRSGERSDLQGDSEKVDSLDILAKKYGESRTQMYRYIRIAELSDHLITAVGQKKISADAAVKLTALSETSQKVLFDYLMESGVTVKARQAEEILKGADDLNMAYLDDVFSNEETARKPIKTIKTQRFARYFENVTDVNEIEETIEKALAMYYEHMAAESDEEYTMCDEIE